MGLGGQYRGQANKGIREVWGQVGQEVDETRAFRRERMEVLGKRMGKELEVAQSWNRVGGTLAEPQRVRMSGGRKRERSL